MDAGWQLMRSRRLSPKGECYPSSLTTLSLTGGATSERRSSQCARAPSAAVASRSANVNAALGVMPLLDDEHGRAVAVGRDSHDDVLAVTARAPPEVRGSHFAAFARGRASRAPPSAWAARTRAWCRPAPRSPAARPPCWRGACRPASEPRPDRYHVAPMRDLLRARRQPATAEPLAVALKVSLQRPRDEAISPSSATIAESPSLPTPVEISRRN